MKTKNLSKKLKLDKKTIAQLNHVEMKSLHGEGLYPSVDYCPLPCTLGGTGCSHHLPCDVIP